MELKDWHKETIGQKAVEAFKKNEFDAVYFSTAGEAADFIMSHVKPDITVGFGGSMTIKSMGIQDKVKAVGAQVFDHGTPDLRFGQSDAGPRPAIAALRVFEGLQPDGHSAGGDFGICSPHLRRKDPLCLPGRLCCRPIS